MTALQDLYREAGLTRTPRPEGLDELFALAEETDLGPGAAPGSAPGEREMGDPARRMGREFADLGPPTLATAGFHAIAQEVFRGYQQATLAAGSALESILPGAELVEPRNRTIAQRGLMEGAQQDQREGFVWDVARGVGQSIPSTVAVAGGVASGGSLVPVALAATATVPLQGYTAGQMEYLSEVDEARAKAAAEGKELPRFDPAEMRKRGIISGTIEGAVEAGGATLGAKALGKWVLRSKVVQDVGRPLAAKAIASNAGQAAGRILLGATNGSGQVSRGFVRKIVTAAAISGAEEGFEELASAALNAPFTAKPMRQDLADGIYSAFVGAAAGGLGGTTIGSVAVGSEALANRKEALREPTAGERGLAERHRAALAGRIDPSGTLERVLTEEEETAASSIRGADPTLRPRVLSELADRVADTAKAMDDLLAQRQEYDTAILGARQMGGEMGSTVEAEAGRQIEDIDRRILEVQADRVKAVAAYEAGKSAMGDATVRMDAPSALRNLSERMGRTLESAEAPRWGGRVQREVEAMGGKVHWYKGGDRAGFFTTMVPGTIFLNSEGGPARVRAVALEEVFHNLQMYRPDLAGLFADKAGLVPVYEAASEYVAEEDQSKPITRAAVERLMIEAGLAEDTQTPEQAQAGAARISEEGEANAFARASEPMIGGPLSGLYRAAARMGFKGREALAAVSVLDAIQRARALEKPTDADFTLSPLARTLAWAKSSPLNYATEIENALKDEKSEPNTVSNASERIERIPVSDPLADLSNSMREKPERTEVGAANQTETPEFKRWFGDSKVVDKDGRPLVVYRGDRPGKSSFVEPADSGNTIRGNIFFSDRAGIAKWYIRNPEVRDERKLQTAAEEFGEGDGLYRVYLSLQNPMVIDALGESWFDVPMPDGGIASIDVVAEAARKAGYDGLIVRNVLDQYGEGTQFVAFSPEQIKSATSNRGTFDPANPDISFAGRIKSDVQLPLVRELTEALEQSRLAVSDASKWLTAAKRNTTGEAAREKIEAAQRNLESAKEAERSIRARLAETTQAFRSAMEIGRREGRMSGVVAGMMEGRRKLLAQARNREDAVKRMVEGLREAYTSKARDSKEAMQGAIKVAAEAAKIVPAAKRGVLLNRVSEATTLDRAFKVAHVAVKLAADEQAAASIRGLKKLRKAMKKHGMRWSTRQQVETLIDEAESELRDLSGRRLQSIGGMIGAVDLYARVASAATKADDALAMYVSERDQWKAAEKARNERNAADARTLLDNTKSRKTLGESAVGTLAPFIPWRVRVGRANSDWYTMALELEGTLGGTLGKIIRGLHSGKGRAALEKVAIVRRLSKAFTDAGYADMADYALRGGAFGHRPMELVTVTLGGKQVRIPKGTALDMAASMGDTETAALFPGVLDERSQPIVFRGTETIAEYRPTKDEMQAIQAMFTPSEIALVKAMKSEMESLRDRTMDAIYEATGDQPPIVGEGYWPRKRWIDQTKGDTIEMEPSTAIKTALTNVGFANARTNSKAPLAYGDAVQTFLDHVSTSLEIIHAARAYRDAITVLGNPDVARRLDAIMGKGTADGLKAIVISGIGAAQSVRPGWVDKANRNVAGAVLAYNPNTWAKTQLGGLVRLASEMPLDYLRQGIAAFRPSERAGLVRRIHDASGYFTERHAMNMAAMFGGSLTDSARSGFVVNMRAAAAAARAARQEVASGEIAKAAEDLAAATTSVFQAATASVDLLRTIDENIMAVAVNARLAQVLDEGILSGDEAFREAVGRAEMDFRMTQNVSDPLDDSMYAAMSRVAGKDIQRVVFPFASDPIKARNQWRRAQLMDEEGRKPRTALALGGNIAVNQAIARGTQAAVGIAAYYLAQALGDDQEREDSATLLQAQARKAVAEMPADIASEVLGQTGGYVGLLLAQVIRAASYGGSAMQPLAARPIEQAGSAASSAISGDRTALERVALAGEAAGFASQLLGNPFWQLWRWAERTIVEPMGAEARTKAVATELRRQKKEGTITPEGEDRLREIERENRLRRKEEQ